MASYPKLGDLTIIPAADLTNINSAANKRTPNRVGDDSVGKTPGALYIRDGGSLDYRLVFPMGSTPGAVWKVVDNSATYTPA